MIEWHQQNWSGHVKFSASSHHRPTTVQQVQEIVRQAEKVRVVASGHCFNDIADTTGHLLRLDGLDEAVVIDRGKCTATCPAGMTYETLCPILDAAGFALPNLASLKHISVVGACMTATHGSGDTLGNLATAVCGLEMISADGERVKLSREREGDTFLGAVVAVGALGVVVRLTLDLEPAFLVQQDVYEKLPLADACAHFDEIFSAGYSVSLFTTWQHDWIETVWVKQRVHSLSPVKVPGNLFGAGLASPGSSGEPPPDRTLTPFALPGAWHERLPHYTFHDPRQVGNELQSEYFVPRQHAAAALEAVSSLRAGLAPILGLSEVRTVKADQLWLSSAYGQDIVGIHFNWLKDWKGVGAYLPVLEAKLALFGARPHLGKLFARSSAQLAEVYPRWLDFRALRHKFDPRGKFSNRFVEIYVNGA